MVTQSHNFRMLYMRNFSFHFFALLNLLVGYRNQNNVNQSLTTELICRINSIHRLVSPNVKRGPVFAVLSNSATVISLRDLVNWQRDGRGASVLKPT